MEEKYFVINQSGDGDCYVNSYSKEGLLKKLNKKYWGEDKGCMENILEDNIQYWSGKEILIIKGSIVVPKEVVKVTEYDID